MAEMIRETRSVCPVCMKNLPAKLLRYFHSACLARVFGF